MSHLETDEEVHNPREDEALEALEGQRDHRPGDVIRVDAVLPLLKFLLDQVPLRLPGRCDEVVA